MDTLPCELLHEITGYDIGAYRAPAVEHEDGGEEWYQNGSRHRDDGPAIEYADGTKVWYIKGELQ